MTYTSLSSNIISNNYAKFSAILLVSHAENFLMPLGTFKLNVFGMAVDIGRLPNVSETNG